MNKVFLCGNPHSDWKPAMLPRIMQGFWENDWILTDDPQESEFIYSNDPDSYQQFAELSDLYPNKIKIVNFLDFPDFLPNFPEILERYKRVAEKADVLTGISQFVVNQIKKYLNREAKIIYQPAKDIKVSEVILQESNDKLKFLYVGRASSPNKCFYLVKNLMEKYYSEEQLLVVGTENGRYGKYCGVLDDKWLNIFYNSCDFVLSPSSFEGLNLVSIESILAKKPVILCNNCEASLEFLPEFCCNPDADSMHNQIQNIQNNKEYYNNIINKYQQKYSIQFSPRQVSENIIKVYNDYIGG